MTSDTRKKILVLSVEIADGINEKLEVFEGDDYRELALNFCLLHGLEEKIVAPLTKHVRSSVERVLDMQATQQRQDERENTIMKKKRPESAPSERQSNFPVDDLKKSSEQKTKAVEYERKEEEEDNLLNENDVHSRLYNHAKQLERRRKEAMSSLTSTTSGDKQNQQPRPHSASKGFGFINRRDNVLNRSMHGDYRNFGERLYVEGIVAREQRKLRAESAMNEKLAEELIELRDSPQISALARSMQELERSGQYNDSHVGKSWERLSSTNSQNKRNRMLRVKKERDKMEVKECSFKPKISVRSKELMRERMMALKEHNIPYHDQLFHDAERRRLMQEEFSQWFPEDHTFHPNNSLSRRSMSPLKSGGGSDSASILRTSLDAKQEQQLVTRLTSKSTTTKEKMRQMKELENTIDLESGQELYKPRIGRGPLYRNRNRASLPIGEYLYGLRFEFDDKKEYMMEAEMRRIEGDATKPKANAKSKELMQNLMNRRFEAIYNFFEERERLAGHASEDDIYDSDKDDAIDLSKIEMEMLDDEVQADIWEMRNRILKQTSDNKGSLIDKETFIREMVYTVRFGHHHHPRRYLFSTAHRSNNSDHHVKSLYHGINDDHLNPTFKPKVNTRSAQLASSRRVGGVKVEESLIASASDALRRVEQRRKEIAAKEMEECTFKPKLNITPMRKPQTQRQKQNNFEEIEATRLAKVTAYESNDDIGMTSIGRRASELERLAFGDDIKDFEQLELELDMHAAPVEMEHVANDGVVARQTEKLFRNVI